MSVPTFDPDKHHIGLGPSGGTLLGFFVDGTYQRGLQRFGGPSEFGGQRDQLEPSSLSRWTQDDFTGGGGMELWGEDPAMFTRSKNLLPALFGRTARTVPPLVYFGDAGPITADASLGMFATGGKQVCVVDSDKFRFYDAETGDLIEDNDPVYTVQVATHDPADNKVYGIVRRTSDGRKFLISVTTAGRSTIFEFGTGLDNNNANGIEVTAGRDILVVFAQSLYLVDVNDARDDATNTRVGRIPGQWRDSFTYNGMTYILVTDTEQTTQVVAWDGSQVLPVTTFPHNFLGKAITEYGGRIYVCGSVADITDVDRYGAVYEVASSSSRLLYSAHDAVRAGLEAPSVLYEMTVHDGLLFIGTDLGWLMAYDVTRDALWSEIEIVSETGTRTMQARRLLSTREKLFAWCFDSNRTTPEDGFYRMATENTDLTAPTPDVTYDIELETSDFADEPAREKRPSELQVLTRAAAGTPSVVTLEYSDDGGDSWDAVSGSSVVNGRFRESTFDLAALGTARAFRFRLAMTKTTVGYEELVAYTAAFLALDSDKRQWTLVVNAADRIEQLDRATLEQDTESIDSTLWGWASQKTLLDFADVNGETRTVQISNIVTTSPFIDRRLPDGSREGFFSLALTEV